MSLLTKLSQAITPVPCPSFSLWHALDMLLTLLRSTTMSSSLPMPITIYCKDKVPVSPCSCLISFVVIKFPDHKQFREERIYLASRSEFIPERSQGMYWKQEVEAETTEECCLLACSHTHAYLAFFCDTGVLAQALVPLPVAWALLHLLTPN